MKKFAHVFLALTLGLASTASADIFPITKKLKDIDLYMPLRIYMAWSNGSELPGNLEMDGGERREIYVDVADTNENGQIDAEDFSLHRLFGTINIGKTDIPGLADLIDSLAILISEDLSQHSYIWLLENTPTEYSDKLASIKDLVDQYAKDIENKTTVNYSLGAVIGDSDSDNSPLYVSSEFTKTSPAEISSEFAKLPSRLTVARAYVTANQQCDITTLSLSLGFSSSSMAQAYKSTFTEHSVNTPMVNVEIREHDNGGGSCNVGSGLFWLITLVPAVICGKRT